MSDGFDRALEPDPAGRDGDPQAAARHLDADAAGVEAAGAHPGGGHRARRRAGRLGLAGAALVDADLDGVAIEHARDLDVGAIGKARVPFQLGAPAAPGQGVERLVAEDHVGIAHSDGGRGERAVGQIDGRVDEFAGGVGGDVGGVEGRGAHLDADGVDAGLALDAARAGRNRETVGARAAGVAQPAREDAQAVARLLGGRTVGIPDAHAELGAQRRRRRLEDAVGADAAVASAQGDDERRGQRPGTFEDQVVVAKAVGLPEAHGEAEL